MHEAAANANLNLVTFLNFDVDAFLSKLVHALRLSQEQHLDTIALRILINVIRQMTINFIHLMANANGLRALHQLLDVFHQLVYFFLSLLVTDI